MIKQEEQALRQIENQPDAKNQQLVHQISHQYYVSELYMLEAEQLSAGNRRTLVKQRIQLQNLQVDARQAYRNNLQRELSRQQRLDTDLSSEQSDQFDLDLDGQPDSLRQLTINNKRYIAALKAITTQSEQVQQSLTATRKQIREVDNTADDLETMAEWLKLSPAFSENLRTRISRLPANPPIEQLDKDIAQNQIKKYEYQQLSDASG